MPMDFVCPRCGDINRVGSIPSGSTGFRCGGCQGIIRLSDGAAATTRPPSRSPSSSPPAKRWWQFWK